MSASPIMVSLARSASERYPHGDRFARHFAYGKLKGDPVFAHLLAHGLLAEGTTILDLGCGQGLLGALLGAAGEAHARGEWPASWPAPPRSFRLRGIELDRRDAQRARAAGGVHAEYLEGDIRDAELGRVDVAVVLDVLHYIGEQEQRQVLRRLRGALAAGGTLLLRVADGDGSLRCRVTEWLDHAAVLVRRGRSSRLHSRPLAEWVALLESMGFAVRATPMSEGTPFANVLLVARYDPPRS